MTTIATVYIPDERIYTHVNHIHRKFTDHDDALRWIETTTARLGSSKPMPEIFDWEFEYRCPKCGWAV